MRGLSARDVINKNVTEEEILRTCRTAFEGGYTSVKLYFMLGHSIRNPGGPSGNRRNGAKGCGSILLPSHKAKRERRTGVGKLRHLRAKALYPFQFEAQATPEEIMEKQDILKNAIRSKKISLGWHDWKVSVLEGVLARGDRRLCKALELAWKRGCTFDSWSEQYRFDIWRQAIEDCGLSMDFYASRPRSYEEIMPWEHLDYGVSKRFLIREDQKARASQTTPNCKEQCAGCGCPSCSLREQNDRKRRRRSVQTVRIQFL